MLISLGCMLLMLDPTRHVLLDHGGVICEPQKLAMYADSEGHLSAIGSFCRWCSIYGLGLLIIGVVWVLQLPERFLKAVQA